MKRFVLITGILALAFIGCKKEKEIAIEAPKPIKQPFVPEKSGKIATTQMELWLKVNPKLNTITCNYSDSLSTQDAEQYNRYRLIHTKKMDSLCVDAGITGGYEEYLWIATQMTNPINVQLLDSLQLSIK